MKPVRIFCLFFAAMAGLAMSACQNSGHLENLTLYKSRLRQYHDNGEYMHQFASVADAARHDLQKRVLQKKSNEKLAVVFDIDETLLGNWPYLMHYEFGGDATLLKSWFHESKCTSLPPTFLLYQEALHLGYSVFIITGRRESEREPTIENLRRYGITNYTGIYFRPKFDRNPSVIPYKTSRRSQIEASGYHIVMNIGDQYSDLKGAYSMQSYKLPNPFYYLK